MREKAKTFHIHMLNSRLRGITLLIRQFVRYLIVGCIGAGIEVVLFTLLAWRVFPALREDEWVVRLFKLTIPILDPAQRALHFAACMSITFIVSNWAGYLLNVRWVFVSGRYSRRIEISLFFATAFLCYLIGTLLGGGLIALVGTTGTTAYISSAVVSVLINYSVRKFLIFKG